MDGKIVRMLFAGVALAGLSQFSAEAEEVVATTDSSEATVSADAASEVEQKPSDGEIEVVEFPVVTKPRPLFQHATYPAAWKAAQQSNRPILVFVSMPNCHYCVKMKDQVFCRPHVKDLVANSFETIKADRFAHPKLISSLKIRLYPTTVLVSPNNKILDVIEGYSDPSKFQQRLHTGLASLSTTKTIKTAKR